MLVVSCTKSTNSTSSSPSIEDGTFQYKVNGNLVTIKNISFADGEYTMFSKQVLGTVISKTGYMFHAEKGVNNAWGFGIVSDSLTIGNYTYDTTYLAASTIATTMIYNGAQSAIFYAGDYISINITSYSGGFISGNFTAKLTPLPGGGASPDYSKKGTTVITEGQFKNIKCIY